MRKDFLKFLFFLIMGIYFFKNFYIFNFTQKRIDYSIYVNGELSNTIPPQDNYDVSVICDNSDVKWDYEKWQLNVQNNSSKDKCYIEFTSIANKNNISDLIINQYNLGNSNQGNGKIVKEYGYRYEGSDPHNYVLFNNGLWRIIGVFETTLADGTTKQNLTKIIRDETIGSYAFNKSNSNIWLRTSRTRASLNILLNDYYFKSLDGTNSGYCYFSDIVNSDCNYKDIGIQVGYQSMVENVVWYHGGINNSSVTSELSYMSERGTTVLENASPLSVGNIGLMYPSDYGFGVLEAFCPRTTLLNSYKTELCAGKNWILKYGGEQTMGHVVASIYDVMVIYPQGHLHGNEVNMGFEIRPVLYLKSDVYIANPESADGSISNPYVLKI